MRCGAVFSELIYAPIPYSAVFLLHIPAPAPIKIGAVRFDAVLTVLSVKLTPLIKIISNLGFEFRYV